MDLYGENSAMQQFHTRILLKSDATATVLTDFKISCDLSDSGGSEKLS